MDDILSIDKLALFILFVMPGFIALKTYSLLIPSYHKPSSEQLLDAVAYSCINYAILLWPIYSVESGGLRNSHPTGYAVFYMFVVLIAPVSMACLWVLLRKNDFFQDVFHHPKTRPWDYVFGQRRPFWVVVTLKSGRVVGGKYDSNSFASGLPSEENIYLEEAWEINSGGAFERPFNETAGIIVLSSEIETVELFNLERGNEHDRRSEEAGSNQETRVPTLKGSELEGKS